MQRIGNWNGESLTCRTMNMFPRDRLSNLYGKMLKASSFEFAPYIYVVKDAEAANDAEVVYDGVEVKICWHILIDYLQPNVYLPKV